MRSLRIGTAAVLWAVAAPVFAAADWTFDGQFGTGFDNNVGNAGASSDEQSNTAVAAGGGAAWTLPFGRFTALQLRGALDGEAALQVEKLSFARVAGRARFLAKPGSGFYVPVLAVWAGAGVREYGSNIRDSRDYRGGVSLTESVTTAVRLRAEAEVSRRESASRVFDVDQQSFALSADWVLPGALTLYGELRLGDGDIVVSAEGGGIAPKSEHQYLEVYADAIEPDDAFDGDDWNAFRIGARTRIISLGVNWPLSDGMALDAQLRQAHSSADVGDGSAFGYDGLSYDRYQANVTLLKRF